MKQSSSREDRQSNRLLFPANMENEMLLCYYLGAVLMLSDGGKAMPITSGTVWWVTETWGKPYLQTFDNRGNQRAFELDSSYLGMPVDLVLQTCDEQARQPSIHP